MNARWAWFSSAMLVTASALSAGAVAIAMAAEARLTLVCNSAARGAVEELKPVVRARARLQLETVCGSTAEGLERVNRSDAVDVIITTREAVQELAARGLVKTSMDLAVSDVGIAVANQAEMPVMKSREDFVVFLRATPSFGYTTGASGQHFDRVVAALGLGEVMKPKSIVVSGGGAAKLLSAGRVAAALQQVSELRADGARYVVALPEEVQMHTSLAIAILTGTTQSADAAAVVRVLTSSQAASVYRRWGLAPVVH